MKKILSIVLLLVYGISSSGMTLHFHYCCGRLDKVQLSPIEKMKCGRGHNMQHKSCCQYKQVELKLKADQKTEQANKFISQAPVLPKTPADLFVSHPVLSKSLVPEIFAPPPLQTPIHIFNCVYRI